MPVVNLHQAVVRAPEHFTADGEVKNKTSNVSANLITVSSSTSKLIGVGVSEKLGASASVLMPGVLSDKSLGSINKHTAKAVLSELVKLPRSENTYIARLACLKADHSIPTWQALTHNPERLEVLERISMCDFDARLAGPGVWLPEVENINTNTLMNLTVKLAAQYKASFQSLLLSNGDVEKQDVTIVRGSSGSGKTSYLKDGFSLGSDEVKRCLQQRMPGVTMPQLYVQGYIVLEKFMSSMEQKFAQGLTRDAMYLGPETIEEKLRVIGLQQGMQKAAIHDIQVDLMTLCCRILKRPTDEPLLNFESLSQCFRSSLENRQMTIELVQKTHDTVSEYSLSVWDGTRNIKVAERSAGSQEITIHDRALFDQHVARDPVLIETEIERVRDTKIDRTFISVFTSGFEPAVAAVFTDALSKYDGKTIAEALELHRDRDHVATSVASRVLAEVVPS
ncbi:hypothetical protein D3C71_811930 [compost metagenome]